MAITDYDKPLSLSIPSCPRPRCYKPSPVPYFFPFSLHNGSNPCSSRIAAQPAIVHSLEAVRPATLHSPFLRSFISFYCSPHISRAHLCTIVLLLSLALSRAIVPACIYTPRSTEALLSLTSYSIEAFSPTEPFGCLALSA